MTRFPGIGGRLADRMQALGYWKDRRPDVGRFCVERHYRPQYVYAWLRDRVPDYDNLRRLSSDLDVAVTWLLSGEDGAAARSRVRVAPAAESQVSIVDVSVLREATERIVSLQSELEAMLAAFPDPCVWVDEHGRIVSAKGGVAVNQSLREAMPPEASAALHRALSTAMKSRAPVTTEYHVGAADGPRRTYEARVVPLAAAARSPKLFIVIRDVTEHRARETDYREMVDGSANGLCIHRHYVLQFANRTMARMLGYDRPADLVGVDIRTLIPGHRAPTPAANSGAARPGTRRQQVEGVKRDGQRVRVTALVAAVTWRSRAATIVTLVPVEHPVSG